MRFAVWTLLQPGAVILRPQSSKVPPGTKVLADGHHIFCRPSRDFSIDASK
jgi:hypothetical protein